MAVTESMLVAIGGVITIGAAALATVIAQLEKSRCTEIDCLCCKCKRRPLDADEEQANGLEPRAHGRATATCGKPQMICRPRAQ